MRTLDIMKRAGRNLRQAKGRTFLTSLAIAVGAFTLTASLAVGEGARQYADKLLTSNINPQTIMIAKDKSLFGEGGQAAGGGLKEYSTSSTQYGGATFKALDASDIAMIKQAPHVESVVPMYLVNAQYIQFEGSDKKFVSDITMYDTNVLATTAAGVLPKLGEQIGDDEVVVPESFLEQAKPGASPQDFVGKKVSFHLVKTAAQPTDDEIARAFMAGGQQAVADLVQVEARDVSFTVRAISAKSSTSFSASSALFISETRAKELSDFLTAGTSQANKYITAVAKVADGNDPQATANYLNEHGVTAKTAKDLQGMIFTIVNILQGIVAGFGVLALIASVFGIINTQYISVLERTSQIGLMKALGMSRRQIAKLFRYEAAWIGFIGGVLGSGAAVALGLALNPWITKTLTLGDNTLLIFVWWHIAILIGSLVVVAIVAGWFPARKAARLDPIEALRTE